MIIANYYSSSTESQTGGEEQVQDINYFKERQTFFALPCQLSLLFCSICVFPIGHVLSLSLDGSRAPRHLLAAQRVLAELSTYIHRFRTPGEPNFWSYGSARGKLASPHVKCSEGDGTRSSVRIDPERAEPTFEAHPTPPPMTSLPRTH